MFLSFFMLSLWALFLCTQSFFMLSLDMPCVPTCEAPSPFCTVPVPILVESCPDGPVVCDRAANGAAPMAVAQMVARMDDA